MQEEGLGHSSLDAAIKTRLPAIGIDLGGTKLSAALVVDYQIVGEAHTVATPSNPKEIVEAIINLVSTFKNEGVIAGVGVATAGVVDTDRGDVVGSTNNLPGWTGTKLKELVEGRTLLSVHVENDANAAAFGDCHAMSLSDKRCVIGVTLGTGIGTGIVINGRLYRGAHFVAGECGHMRIALDNKRMCTCGLFDCWEAYGSGRGLVTTARELLQGVTAEQSELALDPDQATTHKITAAADAGDLIASKSIEKYHEHVAVGLVNLAHTLDPDCFILSGGMSRLIDFDRLKELVSDRCLPRIAENLEILPSKLGLNAGIIGAAHLVMSSLSAPKRQ